MRESVEESTKNLVAWVAHVPKGQAKDFMKRVTEAAGKSGSQVLVVRGDLIFGSDHMRTAMYHARRAIDEGRNASDSLPMETLLYCSGERQLSSAISKMSVNDQTEDVAVVSLGSTALKPDPSWVEMKGVLDVVDESRLAGFGISDREIGTVSPKNRIELVLERVAAVDILKK